MGSSPLAWGFATGCWVGIDADGSKSAAPGPRGPDNGVHLEPGVPRSDRQTSWQAEAGSLPQHLGRYGLSSVFGVVRSLVSLMSYARWLLQGALFTITRATLGPKLQTAEHILFWYTIFLDMLVHL